MGLYSLRHRKPRNLRNVCALKCGLRIERQWQGLKRLERIGDAASDKSFPMLKQSLHGGLFVEVGTEFEMPGEALRRIPDFNRKIKFGSAIMQVERRSKAGVGKLERGQRHVVVDH